MKEAKITRTFKTTRVSVLCLNIDTAEAETVNITLPSVYDSEDKAMKAVVAVMEKSSDYPLCLKPVSISYSEVVEELYGMDASVFLAHAEKLPPRNVK